MAAEGCHMSICGRDRERLTEAETELRQFGGTVISRRVDLRVESDMREWVTYSADQLDGLDIVVTNSDGPPKGPVDAFGLDDYREAFETAILPHIGLVLATLPHLRASGWGRILIIASETARQPREEYGLSSALRPGLLGFARALVGSLRSTAITVNVLAPGYHDTEGTRRYLGPDADNELARIGAEIPVGRVGRVEDFGTTAVFLASDAASFITGTCILVDGGVARGLG